MLLILLFCWQILEKHEELQLLNLEREKLLSEVADNEIRLKDMTEELGKSKDNLADAQLRYVKSDEEYIALKQLHEELEQKYVAASENNEQMKLQIDILSKEARESETALDEVKLEVSVSLFIFADKKQGIHSLYLKKKQKPFFGEVVLNV